jgi:hypothetical protein
MKTRLEKFAGQTFEIIPYWQDKESLGIANRIADLLIASHWSIDQPKQGTMLVGVQTGVTIAVAKAATERTKAAAKELAEVLNSNGIETAATEEDDPASTDKINMSVGIKP